MRLAGGVCEQREVVHDRVFVARRQVQQTVLQARAPSIDDLLHEVLQPAREDLVDVVNVVVPACESVS